MMTGIVRYNINLFLVLALLSAVGCQSPEKKAEKAKKKELALIELHLEVTPDGMTDSKAITINRREPLSLNVDKDAFVDGGYLTEAKLIDEGTDLYSIQLKFNWSGAMRLNTTTSTSRGKHIAVFCTFGESRWLAAPLIRKPIMDGLFTFTPDASREEAERIVRGLNHVAEKVKKDDLKW